VSKSWNRIETWLTLLVLAVGGVLTAIAALHTYITSTATPLHPEPDRVSSIRQAEPDAAWAEATERARRDARAGLVEQNLPGLSVAVGVDGEVVWAEGFGWADLESRTPVKPETRFRIGTASIPLTAAAAGLLMESGRLELDAELRTYVPEYPKKEWPVTLRQVMGHTAGINSDGGDEGPLFGEHCERPLDALPHFADASLRFEPGTRYQYSRYGWILVSAAIEAAAHESFLGFMRARVFEPLGMKDTRADSDAEGSPGRATPYFPRYAADPRYGPDPMRPLDYSCYAGSSVFVSTPSDLVRFGMAMQRGTLLKPETVRVMQTAQRLPAGAETGYGLGWDLETVSLAGTMTQVVGHDGDSLGGIVASLMIFPDRGLVVAVVTNTSYADTPAIALKVAEAYTGK
jgi:serine beta-lactamase-like protein LACTB